MSTMLYRFAHRTYNTFYYTTLIDTDQIERFLRMLFFLDALGIFSFEIFAVSTFVHDLYW